AGTEAKLWCATRGAVVAEHGDDPEGRPAQALHWGFGRVAALEHPELWAGLVDLPESLDERAVRRLAVLLTGATGEDQVALRHTGLYGRRLLPAALEGRKPERDWRPDGTTLITGGTGALGAHTARWLASRGAEHLLLVS